MPKSVYYIAQELSRLAPKIKKVLVLVEFTDGTFTSEDNEITVNEAEELITAFRHWLRQSNAKHVIDEKVKAVKKHKYLM